MLCIESKPADEEKEINLVQKLILKEPIFKCFKQINQDISDDH
jgi:hypothetical protein